MAEQLRGAYRKRQKVRQACDSCHDKKIRCDASMPCANCEASELPCSYLSQPKKTGPKGPRIVRGPKILKKKTVNLLERDNSLVSTKFIAECQPSITADLGHGEQPFQPSPLIPIDIIKSCVSAFFALKYPIMPILDRNETYAMLSHLHDSPENYGLITALCAVVILQPEALEPPVDGFPLDLANAPSSQMLIQETLRARQYSNYIEEPTLVSIHTSFFLFAALFCVNKDQSAWFYLREAATLLQVQHLHEEATYAKMLDDIYATRCRRTFWLLFITERAYALQRNRPLTLKCTINLPTVDPGPEAIILHGFLDLVSLFQYFDDTFISLWNHSSTHSAIPPHRFIHLQDVLSFALPDISQRTEIQQADLLVTRQWLKTMVWQLCVARSFLSSATTHECMSFDYPIAISRDIAAISHLLPAKAFEAHGVGILEKVFDVGCSLADVLLLHADSIPISGREIGPRDYLMELVRIQGTVMGGSSKYLRLLAAKADECLHVRIRAGLDACERSSRDCKDYTSRDVENDESDRRKRSTLSLSPVDYAPLSDDDSSVVSLSDYFYLYA